MNKEIIYSRESDIKNPLKLFGSMFADILHSRELAWRLFVRNTSALYRRSYLGYLWAILPPIVVTILFLFLQSKKILNIGETSVPYEVFVLAGVVLWQLFHEAIFSPLKIIKDSKPMLAKTNFPREALIIAGIYDVLLNSAIRILLLVLVMFLYGISPDKNMLLVPIGIMSIMIFGIMCGVLLAPISLLYDDIEKALTLLMSMLFLITPVVYPPSLFNENSLALLLNPIATLLISTRQWLLNSADIVNIWLFILITTTSILMLFVCWVMYRIAMPHMISRIGS